jgi:TRAP-type C4-dicarboxylate transport system permease large subunit
MNEIGNYTSKIREYRILEDRIRYQAAVFTLVVNAVIILFIVSLAYTNKNFIFIAIGWSLLIAFIMRQNFSSSDLENKTKMMIRTFPLFIFTESYIFIAKLIFREPARNRQDRIKSLIHKI